MMSECFGFTWDTVNFLLSSCGLNYHNDDNSVDNTRMFWLLLSSANPKSRAAGLN